MSTLNDWRYARGPRRDVITIPIVWLAVLLSLLVHVTALFLWLPTRHINAADKAEPGKASQSLAVQIAPRQEVASASPAAPPPSPPIAVSPSPPVIARAAPRRNPPSKPATPAPTQPPVITQNRPGPSMPLARPPPVPEPTPAPTPPSPPPAEDLSAYIASQQTARGQSAPSSTKGTTPEALAAQNENERMNQIIAANIGANRTPTFGYDPKNAGGIFQIVHLDESYADFYFLGLDKNIGRNAKQLIEVRKPDNADIRVAVVRRMIQIIRENVSGDFVWLSRRAGGQGVTLSARASDNAALEDYILRDVFQDARGR